MTGTGLLCGLAGTALAGRLAAQGGALTRVFAVAAMAAALFILWQSAGAFFG